MSAPEDERLVRPRLQERTDEASILRVDLYFARPKLTHLTLSHTNPKRKRGCEWRPRLHFGLVSVTAAQRILARVA